MTTLSGITPSGDAHVGSLLGAIRGWVAQQRSPAGAPGTAGPDLFYFVADLHALTVPQDPARLNARSRGIAGILLAAGIDPKVATLFVQSHVPAHACLSWLLECTAGFGELRRMTQFKEKSRGKEFVSAGLLTYPALMAADVLAYGAETVPVGDDQRQHVELARDVAARFNSRYGETFVVPEAVVPAVAARVMDLQDPSRKMSKSDATGTGVVYLLDPPDVIRRKVRRAVTDSGSEVAYDPAAKPGVSNLLSLLAALTGGEVQAVAAGISSYGRLKDEVTEALVATLSPLQQRYREIEADRSYLGAVLADGAERASSVAGATLARAERALGLLAPVG
ncbi:MAG: tryptophan--tRNA ligase [Acidimicrobiales bacterium]